MSTETSDNHQEQTSPWLGKLIGTDGEQQQQPDSVNKEEPPKTETTDDNPEKGGQQVNDTADQPDNTNNGDQQQNNNTIDVYAELAKISGNTVTSEESFNTILEQSKKFTDLESRYNMLNQEFETVKSNDPFANDYIKKLNELHKTGDTEKIRLFQRVNSIGDVNSLSDYEAVSFMNQWKNDLSPDDAERLMKRDFKTDPEQHSEETIAESNIDLKIKGKEARQFLAEQQASVEVKVPEAAAAPKQPTEAELKAEYDAKVKAVEPLVKTIEQEIPGFFTGVNTNGLKDDKAINLDLPVPQDVQKQVSQIAQRFAIDLGIDPANEAHVSALKDFAKNTAKYLLYDKHIVEAANQREVAVRAEYQNPSNIKREFHNPEAPKATSLEQSASYVAENM